MSKFRVVRARRASLVAIGAIAAITLSGCATGAPKSSSTPASNSSSAPSSSVTPEAPETSTSAAPEPEATPAETTSAEPTSEAPAANQPTVVYTKAAATIGPGDSVKVTITVQTPNPGVPFGDVTLVVDGANYASATINEAGNMTFTVNGLSAGKHSYRAAFAGNATYVASESATKSVSVLTAEEVAAAQKKKEEAAAAAASNPCPATAEACIDLTNNTTWLQQNGVVTAGPYKQIAGRQGHRTPTGTYTVQWKDIDHLSKEFNNAPMPYSIFFNGGIAFHVGSLSTPSHGCIHLSESAAKVYWDALRPGDVVYVFGQAQY